MTDEPRPDDALLDDVLDEVPPRDADEQKRREPFDRLVDMIRENPTPPPGWEARVDARLERERARLRRRRLLAAGGLVVIAAAVIALLLLRTRPPSPRRAELQVSARDPHGRPRRGDAAVHDVLTISVPLDAPHVQLRVYRASGLVLVCPGDGRCASADGKLTVSFSLAEAGTYQILRITSTSEIPAAGAGPMATLDADILALRRPGITIVRQPPMIVSQ